MTRKYISLLLISLFLFGTVGMGSAQTVDSLSAPDPKRNMIIGGELWTRYKYNSTGGPAAMVLVAPASPIGGSQYQVPSFLAAGTVKQINTSLATLTEESGAVSQGLLSDLNTSAGIKFSDSVVSQFFYNPPTDYTPSGINPAEARDIGNIQESYLLSYTKPQKMQYFVHSSDDLETLQENAAKAVNSTWTAEKVNVNDAYLRLVLDKQMFEDLESKIVNHEIYQTALSRDVFYLTDAETKAILEDVLYDFTLGIQLNHVNETAVKAKHPNYSALSEFEATLNNRSDTTLDGYMSDSSWMTTALISYVLSTALPAANAMVAQGQYGLLNVPEMGMFKGAEVVKTQTGVDSIAVWLDKTLDFTFLANNSHLVLKGKVLIANPIKYIQTLVAEAGPNMTFLWFIGGLVAASATYMGIGKYNEKKRKADRVPQWAQVMITFIAFFSVFIGGLTLFA